MDLGVVTAQSQRQTLVIAPEVGDAQLDVWRQALDVDGTAAPSGKIVAAERVPGLSVYIAGAAVGGVVDSDLLVGRDVRRALHEATAGSICFIALTAEANPASLLAALRESDAAIILLRTGSSRITEVRDFLQEAQNLETPLLGSIVLPKLRGKSGPLVPAASETPLAVAEQSYMTISEDGDDDDLDDVMSGEGSAPGVRKAPRRRSTPRRAVDAASASSPQE